MGSHKITIYLLNYNYKRFLPKAIDSILNQSDNDFDVILIDNGSTDGSVDYLEKIRNQYSWEFWQFKNIPLGAVGNRVLNSIDSDYIVRLDADDWLDSSYISEMKKIIYKDSPSLVFGNFFYVDGKDKVIGEHHCLSRGLNNNAITHDEPLHGACTLIKREDFLSLGGYYENFSCQDGFDLYLKLRNHKISLLDHKCFFYRKGHTSLSTNKSRLFDTRIKMIEQRATEEALTFPKTLYLLINDSGSISVNEERKSISNLASFLTEYSSRIDSKVIIGYSDTLENWSEFSNIPLDQWTESEAQEISSHPLIERVVNSSEYEYVCIVNISEALVPKNYLLQASRVAQVFNTDGSISGYRFDQSLFRPIAGGVQQVSKDGTVKDVDRWVVHIGGLTCIKTDSLTKKNPIYSLIEIEAKELKNIEEMI
ncbi:glycosyltransferase family 2 protein [Litoribrevibacter euphylliae]|uniref:Glycosyltransferase family 2 protein n=1 Tax=Litoribrevibacter euphylliae TaxID=1834034 RepID=A0ABV7H8R5_9GAMM